MDLIVALDLISDENANRQLHEALKEQGFEVSREASGKRWRFFKEIGKEQYVIAELHAPLPDGYARNLKANRFTVTIDERDVSGEVVKTIRATKQFKRTTEIYRDFFTGEHGWANEVLKDQWSPEDLETVHAILASWYHE